MSRVARILTVLALAVAVVVALAPNIVRWLMVARKFGYWETTQETAWSLIR